MHTPFDAAILAHQIWIVRFENSLAGMDREPLDPTTIGMDSVCEFGRWLYANPGDFPSQQSYERIKALHATFHSEAGKIATMLRQFSPREEIDRQLTELRKLSKQLIAALKEAKAARAEA